MEVADHLRKRIEAGLLEPGTVIPGQQQLAEAVVEILSDVDAARPQRRVIPVGLTARESTGPVGR